MTSETQQRVGRGVPQGGEFTSRLHAEPEVRLAAVKLFDADNGTYTNPAPPKTADHCIEFWSTVEVPDKVIEQLYKAFGAKWAEDNEQAHERLAAQFRAEWEETHPKPKKDRHLAEWEAECDQAMTATFAQLEGVFITRPRQLNAFDGGQLVRAARMYECAPHKARFPEEHEKVMEHEVELFDETLTVRQIEDRYRLQQIVHEFDHVKPEIDPERVFDALRGIASTLEAEHLQSQRARNIDGY
ncbi:hypothetical protein [Sinomonas gamaensis]|uniref:hypothetical protein n=1 Tax=Sinomonas gamaensis TaxID=2565624 RepID=UPI0011090394|nr:hypothetical protein [Sinomonas gamaensis]